MALTSIYTLHDRVAAELSGCNQAAIYAALRVAAQRFCRDSWVWRETQEDLTLEGDESTYQLEIPAGYDARILRVCKVTLDDIELDESLFTVSVEALLTFESTSASDRTMEVEAVYLPKAGCYELPDWLVEAWGDVIVAGTLWLLRRQSGRPWANPRQSDLDLLDFIGGIGTAKGSEMDDRQNQTDYMRPPDYV